MSKHNKTKTQKSVIPKTTSVPQKQKHSSAVVLKQEQKSVTSRFHSGPLPTPDYLIGYEQACPGATDRILKMAEQQATHRQTLEQITVKSQARNSLLGILSGTLIGLTGIFTTCCKNQKKKEL